MKTAARTTLVATVLGAALLGGCASTPQPALDQANNGAALTMALQAEIAHFRTLQTAILKERMAGIQRQQNTMASYEIDFNFDERLLTLAGKRSVAGLYKELADLSDSRVKDEQALGAKLAAIQAMLDKLLTPLPDASKGLAEAQQAMAVLGEQLSAGERLAIVTDFAKALDKSIKDNQKKIEDAHKATPTAPNQEPKPADKKAAIH